MSPKHGVTPCYSQHSINLHISKFALFKRFIWTIYSPYFQQKKLVVKDMANKAVVRGFLAYLLNLGQFSSLELP